MVKGGKGGRGRGWSGLVCVWRFWGVFSGLRGEMVGSVPKMGDDDGDERLKRGILLVLLAFMDFVSRGWVL